MSTELPAGLVARPLTFDDTAAVTALMAAEELATVGEVAIEEADIIADWQHPGFDLATATIGVFADHTLVGYAEHSRGDRGDAGVHPDWHGRGIGTWLAHWLAETARSRGEQWIGMPTPEGSPGDRLLAALGWQSRWHSWVLRLPAGREVPTRTLPAGYAVGEATPEQWRAVQGVLEDAFSDWARRERETFEAFGAAVLRRPGFEPWHLRAATKDGEVVGAAVLMMSESDGVLEGYVDRLGVLTEHRGRGVAQALLVDAFAVARAHGSQRSSLATDSRTGALDLYLKVGMEVTQNWVNRALRL